MWNVFKLQLYGKFNPTSNRLKDLDRLGKLARMTHQLYSGRHIEVTTAGGRLRGRGPVMRAWQRFLEITAKVNRFSPHVSNFILDNQLRIFNLIYFTGAVMDGPVGTVITLFPGIWTNLFFKQNYIPAGLQWIDSLMITMYIQKMSVIGIRIGKPIPFVTPWCGYFFKTFDSPGGLFGVPGPVRDAFNGAGRYLGIRNGAQEMKENFAVAMDLLAAFYSCDQALIDLIKQRYYDIIDKIYTPALYNIMNSYPSLYGESYNYGQSTVQQTAQFANLRNAAQEELERIRADLLNAILAGGPAGGPTGDPLDDHPFLGCPVSNYI